MILAVQEDPEYTRALDLIVLMQADNRPIVRPENGLGRMNKTGLGKTGRVENFAGVLV
jgi:hypothetical protein